MLQAPLTFWSQGHTEPQAAFYGVVTTAVGSVTEAVKDVAITVMG